MTRSRSVVLSIVLCTLGALLSVPPVHAQNCSFSDTLQTNPETLAENEPVQGTPAADLLLVEFFDPNCPHCQKFKPVMEEVMSTYGDRVRYYKQPVPLWQFSRPQIRAILLAKEKGKYYEMIDAQLTSPNAGQGGLSTDQIVALAEQIGIDPSWMRSQMEANAKQSAVNRLPYEARRAGVDSTPTLAIGRKVVGNRSATCIGQLIEQELGTATETPSSSEGR